MIILKHLTVERFRLLREMNLHFPQRGSILVQGPNESGKSALIESIYFALYGEALSPLRNKQALDELISYGASSASVTLSLSVGATELTIARTIERGQGQRAALYVRRLGMPEEEAITRLNAVDERIISELGRVDGEALRNSCLLEQKGLDRLERLSGSEREKTVRKVLGLEKLMRMTEHFKVTPQDEQALDEARARLQLAEIQDRIPEISRQLDLIEAALDAVSVSKDLEDVSLQEAEIAEQELTIENIQTRRTELKSRQGRIQQLKRAEVTLSEIIGAYDDMAEARREMPILEKQIADLERREHEELPALEKRVSDLNELTRSFETLQRMSNDLLTAVDTIKELEQELKQQDALQDDLKSLEEQVTQAQARVKQAQDNLENLDERRRAGRPQLEERLERLKVLSERLGVLRQTEDQYMRRLASKEMIEENGIRLKKLQKDLRETEQELELVENEAKQAQQRADAQEKRWRQISLRRQLEEWVRLRGLAQGINEAEQHVMAARQNHDTLALSAAEVRSTATLYGRFVAACVVLLVIATGTAVFELTQHGSTIAAVAGVAALLLLGAASLCYKSYTRAREDATLADSQIQEALSRVRMMAAAREAAARMGGTQEDLGRVEHEIRSLGGSVPRSLDEAQYILHQMQNQGESIAEAQQQINEVRDEANAARNQVNVTMEAVATLRKERAQLEEQRKRERWDEIDELLEEDQAAVERMHQEITLLAGQEGLPQPSINERLRSGAIFSPYSAEAPSDETSSGVPDLEELVEGSIKAVEREIAALDGKLDLVNELEAQVKLHQDALDLLLSRKRVVEERNLRYQTSNPMQQIERAREQQTALRNALQSLQDSLRQRVKPLNVVFGQTAINNAEIAARKQMEELQITLGGKITLQDKHSAYATLLKERQESLAEHYKQLAKFSNTLGSWIVPPNPFADALTALRIRCQREIQEANEEGIVKEFETLRAQEGACEAKIELCQQEIEAAHERIATMLAQRKRPTARSFTFTDLVAVWPLLSEYSVQDRGRLEERRVNFELELAELEQEELKRSEELQTGGVTLDLKQARTRMEAQERSYETKKRGNQLVKAVSERLMRKILPRTEYYMQQILPLLTSGRYHDVHLTTEPEEGTTSGGPYQLSVWDSGAGEYVSKSALSGGAADQLSLALRLSMAIAVLPRELKGAPGFVILDEPLSSFDRSRTQALVDVVTGEVLSQHFEQIMLVSHSSAFDPAQFPYHLYMDNGLVVESNLPVVPVEALPDVDGNETEGTMKIAIPRMTPIPVAVE